MVPEDWLRPLPPPKVTVLESGVPYLSLAISTRKQGGIILYELSDTHRCFAVYLSFSDPYFRVRVQGIGKRSVELLGSNHIVNTAKSSTDLPTTPRYIAWDNYPVPYLNPSSAEPVMLCQEIETQGEK